ncbi:MAG: MgtC/SapB family protein [Ktedonobacteraceae bacterium]|nr:MgtC/SapB family protein [Chloroflexota bacterium]
MISFPTILLRLGVAVILGALVGFERESREHAAGMRTNALVALGSCLFTIISAYGFTDFLSIAHTQVDPTRIASYIVAGIGFLGAGSIFLSHETNRVQGLTTAAAIWLMAAVGMTCGVGLLGMAVIATALGLAVLVALRFVERFLLPRQFAMTQRLYIEAASMQGSFVGQVCDTLNAAGIRVGTLELNSAPAGETLHVVCQIPDTATLARVIDQLRALPEVRAVSASMHDLTKKRASVA